MALLTLKFFSESLGMQTEVYAVVPQKSTSGEIGIENNNRDSELKCLYLLHGLSDDHTIWLRRTSIERYAADYGICVVMPCGGRSFYTDMKYGGKYYTYITEELPRVIGGFLKISQKREDTYIAGLSMGGYGALKSALKNPDKYCAAAGLSSVANIKNSRFKDDMIPIHGENTAVPDSEDLFYLASKTNECLVKPRIYMGEGTEDFMYDDNIRLKEHFESLDYDYTYRESKGEHNWAFWDEYIQYVLKWMFE